MNTKIKALLSSLEFGDQWTDSEIKTRFGIASAKSAARALQSEGYAVHANKVGLKTYYRLGTPTRKVVAAGYKALAA